MAAAILPIDLLPVAHHGLARRLAEEWHRVAAEETNHLSQEGATFLLDASRDGRVDHVDYLALLQAGFFGAQATPVADLALFLDFAKGLRRRGLLPLPVSSRRAIPQPTLGLFWQIASIDQGRLPSGYRSACTALLGHWRMAYHERSTELTSSMVGPLLNGDADPGVIDRRDYAALILSGLAATALSQNQFFAFAEYVRTRPGFTALPPIMRTERPVPPTPVPLASHPTSTAKIPSPHVEGRAPATLQSLATFYTLVETYFDDTRLPSLTKSNTIIDFSLFPEEPRWHRLTNFCPVVDEYLAEHGHEEDNFGGKRFWDCVKRGPTDPYCATWDAIERFSDAGWLRNACAHPTDMAFFALTASDSGPYADIMMDDLPTGLLNAWLTTAGLGACHLLRATLKYGSAVICPR